MKRAKARIELGKDFILICVGVAIAIGLSHSGFIEHATRLLGGQDLASFVIGIFFTSVFTLAPAAVALAHLTLSTPVEHIALWGGLGAMCGDLVLFLFIRDKFSDDLAAAFKPSFTRHVINSFHFGFMKWLAPILGAFIIASPLPDEFGLALMGLSKTKLYVLMPISFLMNAIGIYMVATFAHLL